MARSEYQWGVCASAEGVQISRGDIIVGDKTVVINEKIC